MKGVYRGNTCDFSFHITEGPTTTLYRIRCLQWFTLFSAAGSMKTSSSSVEFILLKIPRDTNVLASKGCIRKSFKNVPTPIKMYQMLHLVRQKIRKLLSRFQLRVFTSHNHYHLMEIVGSDSFKNLFLTQWLIFVVVKQDSNSVHVS